MVGITVGALAIFGSVAGAARWVDGHYDTRAHVAQMRMDDEQARLQSDIDLYLLKIDYLEHKVDQTQQDRNEIEYLKGLVAKMRDRQKHLQ